MGRKCQPFPIKIYKPAILNWATGPSFSAFTGVLISHASLEEIRFSIRMRMKYGLKNQEKDTEKGKGERFISHWKQSIKWSELGELRISL